MTDFHQEVSGSAGGTHLSMRDVRRTLLVYGITEPELNLVSSGNKNDWTEAGVCYGIGGSAILALLATIAALGTGAMTVKTPGAGIVVGVVLAVTVAMIVVSWFWAARANKRAAASTDMVRDTLDKVRAERMTVERTFAGTNVSSIAGSSVSGSNLSGANDS